MINIGNSFKEHRQAYGYTQSELAKNTGIKQQNISRWESNLHNPDILDCIKLANFYGITIDELLGLNDFETVIATPIGGSLAFTSEERELIKKYRELNAPGKKLIDTTINTLLTTLTGNKKNTNG